MSATVAPPVATPPPPKTSRTPGRASSSYRLSLGYWWWALPGTLLVFGMHYVSTAVGGFFAFTDWTGIGAFDLVGFDNFVKIFKDPSKLGAVSNTLFLAITSVIGTILGGLLLALAINRTLKTRYTLRVLFFMPVVLSPLASSYIWKYIFDYAGPFNQLLAAVGLGDLARPWLGDPTFAIWTILIVRVWGGVGFTMVIFLAGLASVQSEIEEAAAIDGANLWQRFRYVVLPALRPAIAITTLLGIVQGLRVFDEVMAMTGGGPAGATETLGTLIYKETFALGNFGYGAALALVLSAIILVFALIQQRVAAGRRES